VVLSQVFAHHENLGYDQYGTLHLAEVDGGVNVESEAVEGGGGAGGEGFCEVSFQTARDSVGVGGFGEYYGGGVVSIMEEVCREFFWWRVSG